MHDNDKMMGGRAVQEVKELRKKLLEKDKEIQRQKLENTKLGDLNLKN